ncbi:hypothetical protein ACHAQH_008709 [Verticillium albo-atrum]
MAYDRVKTEYSRAKVHCLVRLAVYYARGQSTLSEYLNGVLSHLKENDPAHHKFDARRKYMPPGYLWPFFVTDLLVGAVKGLMWSEGFKPMEDLRALAEISWNTDEVRSFQQQSREQKVDLSDLSPEAADLLLVVTYSRRHLNLFNYLLNVVTAPSQSSFDRFGGVIVESRTLHNSSIHQHSSHVPANVELEGRFWTLLLNSIWIHGPMAVELVREIGALSDSSIPDEDRDNNERQLSWGIKQSSPVIYELRQALARRNIPTLSIIGGNLAACSTLDEAQRHLSKISVDGVMKDYEKHIGSRCTDPSEDITVTIVESQHLKGSVRVEVMRLALETFKGLDINARIERPWISELRGFGRPDQYNDEFSALHAAAWEGDRELAEVLVEHGANILLVDRIAGQDARGIARQRGHDELAAWLDIVKIETKESSPPGALVSLYLAQYPDPNQSLHAFMTPSYQTPATYGYREEHQEHPAYSPGSGPFQITPMTFSLTRLTLPSHANKQADNLTGERQPASGQD